MAQLFRKEIYLTQTELNQLKKQANESGFNTIKPYLELICREAIKTPTTETQSLIKQWKKS